MNEETKPTKPLKNGVYIFKDIQETVGGDIISFIPPLIVKYNIWPKKDEETGKECYSEDTPFMGYATYDFGMEMNTPLSPDHNFLSDGYCGLTKESPMEDILMYSVIYDLFHAFCHITEDPNYSHYYWALAGWLNERASVKKAD